MQIIYLFSTSLIRHIQQFEKFHLYFKSQLAMYMFGKENKRRYK